MTDDDPGPALRTAALEELLVERGLVDPAVVDGFVRTYERDVGPLNGATVVARAWTDPRFREWLLRDGTAAIASLGFTGPQGEHMVERISYVPVDGRDRLGGVSRAPGSVRIHGNSGLDGPQPDRVRPGAAQPRARGGATNTAVS